jgi:branched-chain amino acid transport system substrate-binding protein
MHMKRWGSSRAVKAAVAGGLGVALTVGTLAFAGAAGAASSPFIVVIDTGVTGPYGANGTAAVDGTKAAAAVLNKNGGILGHKVQVQVLDNQGNPTNAVSLLEQRLASGPKPSMIAPGSISTEGVAEVPIATAAKIVSVGTPNDSSLNDPTKYPYNFLIAPSALLPSQSLMAYLKTKGYTKLAMISSSDAYGASVAQATATAATANHITLTTATYNDTDLDVTSQLQQLQATKPQALFMQGFGSPVGVILSSRAKLGWTIPTIGDLTASTTPLISTLAGTNQEKNVSVQILQLEKYQAIQPKGTLAYIRALQAIAPITTVLTTSSYQYDSVMVVAQAAKQAGSISTPAITKALEHLKQPASPLWVTLKTYVYTPKNHSPLSSPSNWIYTVPTPLVNGQFNNPSASSATTTSAAG